MSSPSYEPIPTDETSNHSVKTAHFPFRKVTLLVLAFALVALGYKVGQWSALNHSQSIGTSLPEPDKSDAVKQGDQALQEPPVNNTNMPGKYSVG